MKKPINLWLCADCAALEGETHKDPVECRYSYPANGWCGGCQEHVKGRTEWFGPNDEGWRGPFVELPKPSDEDW